MNMNVTERKALRIVDQLFGKNLFCLFNVRTKKVCNTKKMNNYVAILFSGDGRVKYFGLPSKIDRKT